MHTISSCWRRKRRKISGSWRWRWSWRWSIRRKRVIEGVDLKPKVTTRGHNFPSSLPLHMHRHNLKKSHPDIHCIAAPVYQDCTEQLHICFQSPPLLLLHTSEYSHLKQLRFVAGASALSAPVWSRSHPRNFHYSAVDDWEVVPDFAQY